MSDISPSVWQQDKKGEWKLFFNTDSELVLPSLSGTDQAKIKQNNFPENQLILGTLVMTPKGIGRYIKNNKGICSIKFNDEIKEEEFEINSISNHFNCFLMILLDGNINILRIKLKVIGKVEDIYNQLEKIMNINKEDNEYSLAYNGKLLKKEFTFEQLNILNDCKILLFKKRSKLFSLNRFTTVNKYWFTYSIDGICFSSSDKIKLAGIGVYGSYENKTVKGELKILDGDSINSKILIEQYVEVPPAKSRTEPIIKLFFSKPIICQKNRDYSILLFSKELTNSYCGQGGKKIVEGENGISFSFKTIKGRRLGTVVEIGNFPEIYYFTH